MKTVSLPLGRHSFRCRRHHHRCLCVRCVGAVLLPVWFLSGWLVSRWYRRTDFAASPHFVCWLHFRPHSHLFAPNSTHSIHHMCISKPNYAMYKRSFSGKHIIPHTSCLMQSIHISSSAIHPKDFRFRFSLLTYENHFCSSYGCTFKHE